MRGSGLDESAFPIAFNDVDLCIRKCYKLIWSAFARLIRAKALPPRSKSHSLVSTLSLTYF